MEKTRKKFLKYGFCKKSLTKITFAKSVQLVRVSFFRSDFLQNPYFKRFPDFYCESVFRGSYNYCLTWETSPVPLLLPWRRYNTPTSVDHRRRSGHIGQVNFTKFVLFQILWRFGMAFGPLIHFEVVEEINSFLT